MTVTTARNLEALKDEGFK